LELDIPFAFIATDLLSGKKIILNNGKLSSAIRATISLFLIFEPFEYNGMLLVDGGITSNAPIDVVKRNGRRSCAGDRCVWRYKGER